MNMRATYAASAAIVASTACVLCFVAVFGHAPLLITIAMVVSAVLAIGIAAGLVGMAVRSGQNS